MVGSADLFQEDESENLTHKKHAVQNAEHQNYLEREVKVFDSYPVRVEEDFKENKAFSDFREIVRRKQDFSFHNPIRKKWAKNCCLMDASLEVIDRKRNVDCCNDSDSLNSGVDGLLENVEVTVVLRFAFDVPLLVDSVYCLDIVLFTRVQQDLVRGAHLEEAATCLVLTVQDSHDDGFNFWSLNQIQELKLDGDLERISTSKVLLEHDCCQESLVIDRLNVVDQHHLYLVHQLSASKAQTEELLCQQRQKFVQKTHTQ